jgi:hypothetical protein
MADRWHLLRNLSEALKIGSFQHEWTRTTTHRSPFWGSGEAPHGDLSGRDPGVEHQADTPAGGGIPRWWWRRHDAVRTCAGRTQHRDHLRELKPGQGPRGARQPDPAGVCDLQAGNVFLPKFLERFNEKFSVRAAKPEDLHRRITLSPERLETLDKPVQGEQTTGHISDQLAFLASCRGPGPGSHFTTPGPGERFVAYPEPAPRPR